MRELDCLLYLAGAGAALSALLGFWAWQRQRPAVFSSRELALSRDLRLARMRPLPIHSAN